MAEATNSILGEIKLTGDLAGDGGAEVGSNPQLTTISGLTAGLYTTPTITVDTKGRITSITSATPNIPIASYSVKGIVQIYEDTGLTISDGVLSGSVASYTDKGVLSIQSGTGLSISSGVLSGVLASGTSTFGVVKSGNSSNLLIAAGVIDIGSNIPRTNTTNIFSYSTFSQQYTQTYASSWEPDLTLSNQFHMTLTGNLTLSNPPNLSSFIGGRFRIILRQDPTGNRTISYGGYYKFPSGANSTLSTGGYQLDILFLEVLDATNILCRLEKGWN